MRTNLKITLFLILITILVSACSKKATPTVTPTASKDTGIANPASVNCEAKGGKLEIRDRGDLGQYGICVFKDNRQCEEWALYRGECPASGVIVTGYVTDAAVFCAISGGEYSVTGNNGAADEQGTCTFKNSKSCDVWEFFNGKCSPNE